MILVATDFSETSQFAVDHAARHAQLTGATVLVVHVLSIPLPDQGEGMLHGGVQPEDPQAAERRLKEIRSSTDGVELEHRLVSGDPAQEILRIAREESTELIVMGTHGRTGLSRVLMGSVAAQVVRDAPCPVVTVKLPKALA